MNYIKNKFFKNASVTYTLIMINIIVYILTTLAPGIMYPVFALFKPSSDYFNYHQFLTYIFMHGSFVHLLFNMIGLYFIGTYCERNWNNNKQYLSFYIVTGILSAIIFLITEPVRIDNIDVPLVGASGAIYALIIAFTLINPKQEVYVFFIPIPIQIWKVTSLIIGIEFYTVFMNEYEIGGTANWGHIGGAISGFLYYYLFINKRVKSNKSHLDDITTASIILNYPKNYTNDREVFERVMGKNHVYFNCEVFTKKGELLWKGDMKLEDYFDKLKLLSKTIKKKIYIIDEDGNRIYESREL